MAHCLVRCSVLDLSSTPLVGIKVDVLKAVSRCHEKLGKAVAVPKHQLD